MADAMPLFEKSSEPSNTKQVREQLRTYKPDWAKCFSASNNAAISLSLVQFGAPAMKTKAILQGNPEVMKACMEVLAVDDRKPMQWVLTVFYDMLRDDSSSFSVFEDVMKEDKTKLLGLIIKVFNTSGDAYSCDKAAWLYSSLVGHLPFYFSEADVKMLLDVLASGKCSCSEFGVLEATTNVLKSDLFRQFAYKQAGVADRIHKVAVTAHSSILYRSIFAMWLLSYDSTLKDGEGNSLTDHGVVKRLVQILSTTHVEKVVRICLTLLRNLLKNKQLCEELVEAHALDILNALEYQKWRDVELYDEIRDVAVLISHEVAEMSNFERYTRELDTGKLHWGFVHQPKFWAENVYKFEQSDFRAVKKIAMLLSSDDVTTMAVACHDIGEFVTLHPLGKRTINQLGIKDRIMELMGSAGDDKRDVRREALLCCQKIMLNKWQDIEKSK